MRLPSKLLSNSNILQNPFHLFKSPQFVEPVSDRIRTLQHNSSVPTISLSGDLYSLGPKLHVLTVRALLTPNIITRTDFRHLGPADNDGQSRRGISVKTSLEVLKTGEF